MTHNWLEKAAAEVAAAAPAASEYKPGQDEDNALSKDLPYLLCKLKQLSDTVWLDIQF